MKIISLDQPTAATMTNIMSLLKLYSSKNKNGKYDAAIEQYSNVYRSLMDDVLGRTEEAEAA